MQRIRRINPLLRAIGIIGVVAGLTTAITFAALTSNTVALSPNTLASATANLQIGSNTEAFSNTSVAGMTATLVPGTTSAPFTFFLKNNGQSDMNVTAHIPTVFNASAIPPSDVTLSFDCGSGPVAFTLDAWAAGSAAIPGNPLTAGNTWTCTETATLASSYSGAGGQTVQSFDVQFVGNQ
jgi:hypothetical protein